MGVAALGDEAGLGGDVADGAAFRSRPEQGPLRAAQHFHAVEIEHRGQGVVGAEAQRPHLNGRVVDIDARRARTGGGGYPPDGDVVGLLVIGDARGELGQVLEGLHVQHLQLGGRKGADALGHPGDQLILARGGDDHLSDVGRGRVGGPAGRGQDEGREGCGDGQQTAQAPGGGHLGRSPARSSGCRPGCPGRMVRAGRIGQEQLCRVRL